MLLEEMSVSRLPFLEITASVRKLYYDRNTKTIKTDFILHRAMEKEIPCMPFIAHTYAML